MENATFIQEIHSEDTGGGFQCDILVLNDGTVLVIGEDSIVLYSDMDAWENLIATGQLATISRLGNEVGW